jgi:hypothetical protein
VAVKFSDARFCRTGSIESDWVVGCAIESELRLFSVLVRAVVMHQVDVTNTIYQNFHSVSLINLVVLLEEGLARAHIQITDIGELRLKCNPECCACQRLVIINSIVGGVKRGITDEQV